jgi:hypothetical protein
MVSGTQKVYRFLVLEGVHHGKDRVYKKGEIFEDIHPLDEIFVGKFQRISDVIYRDEITPKQQKPDTRMMFVFADALDITAKFPAAQNNNLRVFKDSTGGHAVACAGVSEDELMNIAPTVMGTKRQVDEWLASYLKQEE